MSPRQSAHKTALPAVVTLWGPAIICLTSTFGRPHPLQTMVRLRAGTNRAATPRAIPDARRMQPPDCSYSGTLETVERADTCP